MHSAANLRSRPQHACQVCGGNEAVLGHHQELVVADDDLRSTTYDILTCRGFGCAAASATRQDCDRFDSKWSKYGRAKPPRRRSMGYPIATGWTGRRRCAWPQRYSVMRASLADCITGEPGIPYLCHQHERAFAISPEPYVCSRRPGWPAIRTLAREPSSPPLATLFFQSRGHVPIPGWE